MFNVTAEITFASDDGDTGNLGIWHDMERIWTAGSGRTEEEKLMTPDGSREARKRQRGVRAARPASSVESAAGPGQTTTGRGRTSYVRCRRILP